MNKDIYLIHSDETVFLIRNFGKAFFLFGIIVKLSIPILKRSSYLEIGEVNINLVNKAMNSFKPSFNIKKELNTLENRRHIKVLEDKIIILNSGVWSAHLDLPVGGDQ